jgi:hypothetical protein
MTGVDWLADCCLAVSALAVLGMTVHFVVSVKKDNQ